MGAKPDFDNASLWDVRKDVVVFDEHFRPEKTLPSGKKIPARDFKKPDLETIARNCNDRDAKGLPAALVLGHTTDDSDEKAQPEIVGYDRNFRVEFDAALGKNVIKVDRYLRRERAREAEQYPRTSVEHWINQDFLDPIALVKRTPKLDIPQWHYARRTGEVVNRYSMESDMAGDPTGTPDAAAPNPQLKEMVMACLKECLADPQCMKMIAGGMSMPSPTNGAALAAAPYTADTADVERFASEAEKIRYTRQQAEIDRLKKEAEDLKTRHARADAESAVKQLLFEGIDLSPEYEVQELLRRTDPKDREAYLKNVRERYQRAPVGGDLLRTYDPTAEVDRNRKGDDGPTESETMRAVQYMRKSGKNDFDEALKHVREKKTA